MVKKPSFKQFSMLNSTQCNAGIPIVLLTYVT